MAVSHLCLNCGTDLAHIRARREEHYNLPLVTCPECSTTVVRRQHPVQEQWRSLLRLKTALGWLTAQSITAAGLLAAVTGLCIGFRYALAHNEVDFSNSDTVIGTAAMFILLPLAVGIWLTAGLSHWRRPIAFGTFTALVCVLLSVDVIIGPFLTHLPGMFGLVIDEVAPRSEMFFERLTILAVIVTVALAGIPTGRLLLSIHRAFVRGRWRARRRRFRARRVAA